MKERALIWAHSDLMGSYIILINLNLSTDLTAELIPDVSTQTD